MYRIELGKDKGSYHTVLSTNNKVQAHMIYRGYNVHSGYKKRLKENGRVIARVITYV